MQPEIEQSLVVEFDELFSLGDRLREVADNLRARLMAAGLTEPLQTDVFDRELEVRGTQHERLLIRLDSYRLEISGAPPAMQTQAAAAIILDEAGAFRLTSVELGLSLTVKVRKGAGMNLVAQAFPQVDVVPGDPMLDRCFSMTWDWGTATTGYSFHASDTEDRELLLSFKAREGYMTIPELEGGTWVSQQAQRYEALVGRFFDQLGWKP
ncbi:MAG TPA: hypothetical protein VD902_09970 [Symbiobacteriaceae bacterium]|nr:hypothetical protein [Symbiobacteriaceae bacterium]